ncbi:MAG: methyl-accepting chemotaxis protein [Planctomycetaceae bacterium]|nr:methyl-accepting chemotaxis protein [Planctomycetaceae bacterium]
MKCGHGKYGIVGALVVFCLAITLLFYSIVMPMAVPAGADFNPAALAAMQRTLAVAGFVVAVLATLVFLLAVSRFLPKGYVVQELADAIRQPAMLLDANRRLLLFNKEAERVLGLVTGRDAGKAVDKDILDAVSRGPTTPDALDPRTIVERHGRQYLVLDNPLPSGNGGAKRIIMLRDVTHHMRLRDAITHINETVGVLVANTGKISASAASLSHGATRQADSLTAISESLDEFSKKIQGNTESAEKGTQLAAQAREAAERSGSEIAHALSAMTDVQDAGIRIARIVKLIDDIAFQTNLLALNAAVEAARAGRQGKGFAVVAGEVRNLAGRSAKAAKDTASMVEDVTERIGNASAYISKLEEMLRNIVQDAIRMADSSASATATSAEQATAILQVNQELSQMSSVTRTTMSEAEETASAVGALVRQVDEIKAMLQDVTVGFGDDVKRDRGYPHAINLLDNPPAPGQDQPVGQDDFFSRYTPGANSAGRQPAAASDDFATPFRTAAKDWDLDAEAAKDDATLSDLLRSDGYNQKYEEFLRKSQAGNSASIFKTHADAGAKPEYKTTPDGDKVIKPGQNIHLDDSEFGRY